MAQMWFGSLIPWTDPNGDPYVGALVEFFDAETTTPQVVYTDSSLSIPAGESDRTANASGRFRALFLNPTPGNYRVRVTDEDDTLIEDVDGISVPQNADYTPPDGGETSPELLFTTGMLQHYYGATAPAGWVRANGRTLGSATSGATERANADAEDLFLLLWAQDSALSVSGGRGGTAAGDWAANKTIALPDLRGRALVGLDDMGSTAAGVITSFTTLGGATGAQSVTLDSTQIPSHLHAAGTLLMPNHGHPARYSGGTANDGDGQGGMLLDLASVNNYSAFTGTPANTIGQQIGGSGTASVTGSTANTGGGGSHTNLQPSRGVTIIMKL